MVTSGQDIVWATQGPSPWPPPQPHTSTYLQSLHLPVQQALDVSCHLFHQLLGLILLHLKQIPVVLVDLEGSRSRGEARAVPHSHATAPRISSLPSTVQPSAPPQLWPWPLREHGCLWAGPSALLNLKEGSCRRFHS